MGIVYLTINKINGKMYVGSDTKNRSLLEYPGSGKMLTKAIKKYGIDNFEKIVLDSTDNQNLPALEEAWLKILNVAQDPLYYNIVDNYLGGRTSGSFTKGHQRKRGKKHRFKRKQVSPSITKRVLDGRERRSETLRQKYALMTEEERKKCLGHLKGRKRPSHSKTIKEINDNLSPQERSKRYGSAIGKRWFTNGYRSILINPESKPEGFYPGRHSRKVQE